jgi:hypothetical protein
MYQRTVVGLLAAALPALVTLAFATPASATTLTFDDISSLDEYASLGVTFSGNASIWSSTAPSVLIDPDGGAYSVPCALQFGNAGGVEGNVYFDMAVTEVSVWALSGPGPDNLSGGWVRARDSDGTLLEEILVSDDVQFEQILCLASGIRQLDFFTPDPADDIWDHLSFQPTCPWDLDGSGDVGVTDFLELLAVWGQEGVPADFDGGGVGITDFLLLLANWGPCP